jgi:hypothetical protein
MTKSLKNALEAPCIYAGGQSVLYAGIDGILKRICMIFFANPLIFQYIDLARSFVGGCFI